MPYAGNRGLRIYWEEEGSGEPLLLIMGLGFSHAMWRDLRPALASHFRVIVFDNRGVGASDTPLRPFSIADMAQDAGCVMNAAGVDSAHVAGFSMGGMIAQEFALRYPQRVHKLILACTDCGGSRKVRAPWRVLRVLSPFHLVSIAKRIEEMIPFLYDEQTPPERISADFDMFRQHLPKRRGFTGQIWAILRWSSYDRLPQITAPTLIIHGERDRLVPAENAMILASRIANSKLVVLPRAGHIFPTDLPERTRKELLDFLTDDAKKGDIDARTSQSRIADERSA